MTGVEFAAALDKAGITIARATCRGRKALDALRDEAELAATVAFTDDTEHRPGRAALRQDHQGDYAAVTRSGDVFRLNPTAFDFEESEQRLADVQPRLPSVIEARAQNEINREETAEFWADLREWNAEVRSTARMPAKATALCTRPSPPANMRSRRRSAPPATPSMTDLHTASGFGQGLAKAVENVLGGIFSFFVAEPKLTPLQAELRGPRQRGTRRSARGPGRAARTGAAQARYHFRARPPAAARGRTRTGNRPNANGRRRARARARTILAG